MRRRTQPLLWLAAAFVVFLTTLWQQRADVSPSARGEGARAESARAERARPERAERARSGRAERARSDGSQRATAPEVREATSEVPEGERPQLLETLALIERGGPFPYRKDGTVFSNREGRLPPHPRGYYREYTVPTPGAKNRGARRVVRGKNGETWYTRDHYKTFVRIDE